jgi:protein-disulfide isomerase
MGESTMVNKNIVYSGIVLVVIIFLAWFLFFQQPEIKELSVGVGSLSVLGESSAPVTWIEFSDYQCPFCSKLVIEAGSQVKTNYVDSGKVKMYYRDFPLNFHDKAMDAAIAARCADAQGKFWQMHDKIFVNQNSWSSSSNYVGIFEGYATDLGLNKSEYNSCLTDSKHFASISQDIADGKTAGISGTPAVLLKLPKSKTDLNAVKNTVSKYAQYMQIFENENEYIVKVVGAFPYSAYEEILEAVDY